MRLFVKTLLWLVALCFAWIFFTCIGLSLTLIARSQETQHKTRDKVVEFSLISVDVFARAIDARQTDYMMARPSQYREYILPSQIADHPAAMWSFSMSIPVVDLFAYKFTSKKHRKIAMLGMCAEDGAMVERIIQTKFVIDGVKNRDH